MHKILPQRRNLVREFDKKKYFQVLIDEIEMNGSKDDMLKLSYYIYFLMFLCTFYAYKSSKHAVHVVTCLLDLFGISLGSVTNFQAIFRLQKYASLFHYSKLVANFFCFSLLLKQNLALTALLKI